MKPIPVATVKVYFYLKEQNDKVNMEFRFENDSLIHKADRTIRISKMEVFIFYEFLINYSNGLKNSLIKKDKQVEFYS